ncbi:hypothetical protein MKX03_037386, partial [Papaver bracteatum]
VDTMELALWRILEHIVILFSVCRGHLHNVCTRDPKVNLYVILRMRNSALLFLEGGR